ncbi:MAG: NAD(P)-binding protein [Chromatiales bacterium]|jgi:hypothetical protein|nr:NAD(P)-binding protein [Chromatiales bacterium]
MHQIEADYIVIGAGTMGMAFADTLLHESDASIAIVDRRGRPGGHWTDAYPFVRLHQPSAFYGVNSTPLGNEVKDSHGANAGLYELASGSEVCTYFEGVMHRQMLPSGRVTYLPLTENLGDGRARSLTSGDTYQLKARRRIVDATYMNVVVPSMRPPPFAVDNGVRCVSLNVLGTPHEPAQNYVVIGAGKSAMDACLWLLGNGLSPDRITWVTPRDSWLLDRSTIQFVGELWEQCVTDRADVVEVSANARTVDELFAGLERTGQLMRLHTDIKPTMYRCATVTRYEVEQLRRIKNVIRLGRVQKVEAQRIVLDRGEVPVGADTLLVDCTADGLPRRPTKPVFTPGHITLQTVRTCQQAFSAAVVGHVESLSINDDEKNALCKVVPHPDSDTDWLEVTLGNFANSVAWMQDEGMRMWLERSRLEPSIRAPTFDVDASPGYHESRQRTRELTGPAMQNLKRLIADVERLTANLDIA